MQDSGHHLLSPVGTLSASDTLVRYGPMADPHGLVVTAAQRAVIPGSARRTNAGSLACWMPA